MANATAALSQHGHRFRPHLLKKSTNDKTGSHHYKPQEEYPVQLKDADHWGVVIEGMQGVISSQEGTGYYLFGHNLPFAVAGKSGTAQVFSGAQYEKKRHTNLPEALRDHSLFITFAPVEDPEVAIAVVIENDAIAKMIARKVMDAYFALKETA